MFLYLRFSFLPWWRQYLFGIRFLLFLDLDSLCIVLAEEEKNVSYFAGCYSSLRRRSVLHVILLQPQLRSHDSAVTLCRASPAARTEGKSCLLCSVLCFMLRRDADCHLTCTIKLSSDTVQRDVTQLSSTNSSFIETEQQQPESRSWPQCHHEHGLPSDLTVEFDGETCRKHSRLASIPLCAFNPPNEV